MKILKLVKCGLTVENTQVLVHGLHKAAISRKGWFFDTFLLFFFKIMDLWDYLSKLFIKIFKFHLKVKSINILNSSLLEANKLMIPLQYMMEKISPFLFFATKY